MRSHLDISKIRHTASADTTVPPILVICARTRGPALAARAR